MISGIEHRLYMENDRLMLSWTGISMALGTTVHGPYHGGGGGGGGAPPGPNCPNCGGVVDLTAHIESIVRKIISEAT